MMIITPNDIFYTVLTPTEIVEYTCTAISSLQSTDEYKNIDLSNTSNIRVVQDFIINTLIANELAEGWRDKETGKLI
jgi:hypothetical protein